MGNAILEIMQRNPGVTLEVLCGHTHGKGEVTILPNLLVYTGGAEYGKPAIQKVFNI